MRISTCRWHRTMTPTKSMLTLWKNRTSARTAPTSSWSDPAHTASRAHGVIMSPGEKTAYCIGNGCAQPDLLVVTPPVCPVLSSFATLKPIEHTHESKGGDTRLGSLLPWCPEWVLLTTKRAVLSIDYRENLRMGFRCGSFLVKGLEKISRYASVHTPGRSVCRCRWSRC